MTSWGSISSLQSAEEDARREADKKFGQTMSAWDEGYDLGMRRAAYWDRVDAFGAIRRAAVLARMADRQPFDWMDDSDNEQYAMARGIRMAIRAAIGSDKA